MLKAENFTYWLQGFFEISGAKTLNEEQVKVVKEHLNMCFNQVMFMPAAAQTQDITPHIGFPGSLYYNPTQFVKEQS